MGVEPASLDGLLANADAVTLHIPLTEGTRNLFDASRLAAMKDGAVLVNTARGGIVDETALAQALRDGKLGGAAMDVFGAEPLPAGSPLAGAPNLILTPHIAGLSEEANTRVSDMVAQRVAEVLGKANRGT
jgi:(S)-sulfolactate dehydrogenase